MPINSSVNRTSSFDKSKSSGAKFLYKLAVSIIDFQCFLLSLILMVIVLARVFPERNVSWNRNLYYEEIGICYCLTWQLTLDYWSVSEE